MRQGAPKGGLTFCEVPDAVLADALSGGTFGAEVRAAEPTRAKLVHSTGADVVATIRNSRLRIPAYAVFLAVVAIIAVCFIVFHPTNRTAKNALPIGWERL